MSCRGSWVRFGANSSDASSGVAVSIFDADGNVILLDANERLIIQQATIYATGAIKTSLSATNATSVAETLMTHGASSLSSSVPATFPGEGMACRLGTAPFLRASAAADVGVTGMGYIVKDGTLPGRQSFQNSLVPGS